MSKKKTKKKNALNEKKKPVEVIVFEDPAKRKQKRAEKLSLEEENKSSPVEDMRPVFDQKQAKYDIRKLAMDGMEKPEKQIAMTDFLIELGAKKPKGRHVPMKEYLKEVALKKADGTYKAKSEDDVQEQGKKQKEKRKRDKDDIFETIDGQQGTYKKGVQFIKMVKKRRK